RSSWQARPDNRRAEYRQRRPRAEGGSTRLTTPVRQVFQPARCRLCLGRLTVVVRPKNCRTCPVITLRRCDGYSACIEAFDRTRPARSATVFARAGPNDNPASLLDLK